jgi:hypothetical protein
VVPGVTFEPVLRKLRVFDGIPGEYKTPSRYTSYVVTPLDAVQLSVICGLLPLQPGVALVNVNVPGTAAKAVDALARLRRTVARERALAMTRKKGAASITGRALPVENRIYPPSAVRPLAGASMHDLERELR